MIKTKQNFTHFKAGDLIMRQGERGESAYIIEKGSVEIFLQNDDGVLHKLGTRGEGALIGEMALVDSEPRTATVKAITNSDLLEISREDFERRLKKADPIMRMVMQVVLTRYRDMIKRAHILGSEGGYPTPENLEKEFMNETNVLEVIKLGHEFGQALNNGQVSLHYQPIINLSSSQISGFEALMRWQHPERGFVPPGLFIPIAEENGTIGEVSRWALRESCSALKRLEKETKNSDLFMSVNFSSSDIADPLFQGLLQSALEDSGISPAKIHVEITERMLMEHPQSAQKTLQNCRNMGVSISIDDFGTGYSSLSYLHNFPINILKIDRSFVNNMGKDKSSMELIKSIVALGKNLGMKIIAEGIETEEQFITLQTIGCDAGQGYWISRPMPESKISDFLTQRLET